MSSIVYSDSVRHTVQYVCSTCVLYAVFCLHGIHAGVAKYRHIPCSTLWLLYLNGFVYAESQVLDIRLAFEGEAVFSCKKVEIIVGVTWYGGEGYGDFFGMLGYFECEMVIF